jgi:hypothetical protein
METMRTVSFIKFDLSTRWIPIKLAGNLTRFKPLAFRIIAIFTTAKITALITNCYTQKIVLSHILP